MQYAMESMLKIAIRRGKMIEKGLILTDDDAELLSQALEEAKTKCYKESVVSLNDTQALHALLSHFRGAENDESKRATSHTRINPLSKHLVLGTVIGRPGGAPLTPSISVYQGILDRGRKIRMPFFLFPNSKKSDSYSSHSCSTCN